MLLLRVEPLVSTSFKSCPQVRVLQAETIGSLLDRWSLRLWHSLRLRHAVEVLQLLRGILQVRVVEHVETRTEHVLHKLGMLVSVRLAARAEHVSAGGKVLSSLIAVRHADCGSLAE